MLTLFRSGHLVLHTKTESVITHSEFFKVIYVDDVPVLNMYDSARNNKLHRFLHTKFSGWTHEEEYRMLLGNDDLEDGLIKYSKEDLEGVIFGLRINYDNVKLVYDTIKKNYLDEDVAVNFYEAKYVPRKYAVDIVPIDDVEKYIDSLRE